MRIMAERFEAVAVPIEVPAELGLSGPGIQWSLMHDSGDSGDQVYRITAAEAPNRWVKTSSRMKHMELAGQRDRLNWIGDKLPVPKVLGYAQTADRQWLVTTEIPGLAACDDDLTIPKPEKVRMLARGLREIHSIDPAGCPFVETIADKLARAEKIMETEDHWNRSLYALLQRLPRPADDLVFCHGDYCEPNIMFHEGKISGYVDLGFAGVADRCADFIQACYSLVRNGDKDYVDLFFSEYGMKKVDFNKILYFQVLDGVTAAAGY